MKHARFWYVTLLLILVFVIGLAPVGVNYFHTKDIRTKYLLQHDNKCTVTINEPTIILRIDDVRSYGDEVIPLVNEMLDYNMKVNLAVIPVGIEKDTKVLYYLQGLAQNSNIELAVHGYHHNSGEENITEAEMVEGKMLLSKYLGVEPITYIPPYNTVEPYTKVLLSKHFKIFSAKGEALKEGSIATIGQTISVTNYDLDNTPLRDLSIIMGDCKNSLDRINLCVITFHPQEYRNNTFYKEVIKAVNDTGVRTSNFHDLVYCEEDIK